MRMWLLVVLSLPLQVAPALAGWVPPKLADDHFDAPAPISSAALHKALADPALAEAYRLLTGPRSHLGVELTEKLASAGNPVAQTALCVIHREGYDMPYDFDKAKPWCRRRMVVAGSPNLRWLLVFPAGTTASRRIMLSISACTWTALMAKSLLPMPSRCG